MMASRAASQDPVAASASSEAVDDAAFAALLDRLGPFESKPRLAIGVSGGGDSMALALLADRWARARGGAVTALTVDHGLRPDSAQEAATVGAWLSNRGIAHHILNWTGPKPRAGIQAAARAARRALLVGWCRDAGILHLLLAHQRNDQAETMLLRLSRGSGPDGLAGMAAALELPAVRLLRPLLTIAPDRLRANLREAGQAWIEDPSNRNPAFARTRIRGLLSRLGADGRDPAALARTAAGLGMQRASMEAELAVLLARSVALYPEGWAVLDPAVWRQSDPALSRRALARVVLTIGGADYPPRTERLDRLHVALQQDRLGGGRTLGGCRFLPGRGGALAVRELAAAAGRMAIAGPGEAVWDGRFALTIAGHGPWPAGGCWIASLGAEGWRAIAAAEPALRRHPVPAVIRQGLPALWDLEGVLAVPHLFYRRRGADPDSVTIVSATFCPRQALAGPGFITN